MSFNSNLISIESFLKASNTSADALAARVNLSVFFNDVNVTNFVSLAASIGNILGTMQPQIEEIVRIHHIPGFNLAAYGADLKKLNDSKNADDIGSALSTVLGDIAAIVAGVSVTALGFAVASPFVVGVTAVSKLASVYSSYNDLQNLSQLEAISQWGFQGLETFSAYSDPKSIGKWTGYQTTVYQDYFEKNPATLPALLLVHAVDKNITPSEALTFIENSGVSNRFTDQHIPEVSNFINSLRLLTFGLGTPEVTTKEGINDLVNLVWNELNSSPLAGNVQLVDNFATPFDAATAWSDFGSFLSLAYLTPFTIKPLNPDAEATLKSVHSGIAADWEYDKTLTPEQLANGEGTYSDKWISDRIAMLSWLSASYEADTQSISLNSMSLNGSKHFLDLASSKEINVVGQGDVQEIVFGDFQDNAHIQGGNLGDHLYGGGGFDLIRGYGGNDYIEGGEESDILEGGTGNDTLLGGEGNDTYVYTTGDGFDAIKDFHQDRNIVLPTQYRMRHKHLKQEISGYN